MESKSFVKLLRKIIREEVRAAVRTEIKSVLNENTTVTKHESDLQKIVGDTKKYKPKAKKKFTKNSMLNDILNETAATGDFRSMMDGPAVTQEDWPSMGDTRTSQMVQPQGINGEQVDTSKPDVQTAMTNITKDYSGLMKAMDQKRPMK